MLKELFSDLIDDGLVDMEKCEVSVKYSIDMDNNWHEPGDDVLLKDGTPAPCEVCFAGAVIAMTLGEEPDQSSAPAYFDVDTRMKLKALNWLRQGKLEQAYISMNRPMPLAFPNHFTIADYRDSPIIFRVGMRLMSSFLRANGQ